ncbi:hypothetical protein [Alloactinosynnema sp. L-07]|uniref:hypothetical protein n=1 Tax=Alloactinosynnema sp. L-07 TaxID=1653480 RepID=UPI00065EFF52|nr:hypothetical protein [Alloactinosynnema sp. L-07]CRK59284.1 hypothetical protein [Alloactinosynnema sp. L-07]
MFEKERCGTGGARQWIARPLVTMAVAALAAGAVMSSSQGTETSERPVDMAVHPIEFALSPAEAAEWQQRTATPEGRERVLSDLSLAFSGVASIGTTQPVSAQDQLAPTIERMAHSTGLPIRPVWATGMAGDHFWITASYADVASGAISGAVWACKRRLPGWLCDTAGRLLKEWAKGWGSASNHGVWAAVYWWPPRVTGGRW